MHTTAFPQGARRPRRLRCLLLHGLAAASSGLCRPATARSARSPRWASAARSFEANSGLLYKENFLAPAVFEEVRRECRSLRRHFKRELDSIATGRMGCCVDSRSEAYRSLMTAAICEQLSGVTGQQLAPSEFPIELRLYTMSAEMGWHRDDTLYAEPQTEVVFCVENASDSVTEWLDADGDRHSQWTEPNSALIVRAGPRGPLHRVTPLRRGERTILKLVYTSTAERSADFDAHIDSFPMRRVRNKKPRRGR